MQRKVPTLAWLVPPIALLAGCNAALGPGYTVKKQQLEARWTGTPELAVRGAYRLQNTGKGPLDYIEVTLPPEPRRSGLQVTLDKSQVATQPADKLAPEGTVRIPISPALPLKKKRDLVIEYRLAGSVGDVSATPSFYLETRGWYPALREREGLFGSGGAPPKKWDMRVIVPRDFLVHASGQPKGRKRRGDSVEHRFRHRRGDDFDPFVVSGRYHEHRAEHQSVAVRIWTFELQSADALRPLGEHVASTWLVYERALGALEKDRRVLLAECVAKSEGGPKSVGGTFPGGTLYCMQGLSEPLSSKRAFEFVDGMLAVGWFGENLRFAPEDSAWQSALAWYAVYLASAAGPGSQGRESHIVSLLKERDGIAASPKGMDSPKDWPRGALALNKLHLFLFAAEERYGKEKLSKALTRVVQALRGRQFTSNDLRVAIHLETGEDPAEFFRQWLNKPGIPEEFRQRYQRQGQGNRE